MTEKVSLQMTARKFVAGTVQTWCGMAVHCTRMIYNVSGGSLNLTLDVGVREKWVSGDWKSSVADCVRRTISDIVYKYCSFTYLLAYLLTYLYA